MIQFHDPRGVSAAEPLPYDLAVDLCSGTAVACLANGFPDSANFLARLAEAMAASVPGLRFEHFDKGNASVPANEELLGRIANRCQAAVAAYGH